MEKFKVKAYYSLGYNSDTEIVAMGVVQAESVEMAIEKCKVMAGILSNLPEKTVWQAHSVPEYYASYFRSDYPK